MCVNDTMMHVRMNVCVYICVCHICVNAKVPDD